jgi:hypothetical protein
MTWDILPDGRVANARARDKALRGDAFAACLGRTLTALRFPPFRGEPLPVTFPFPP